MRPRELNHALKTFLREHVYKHYKVRRMTAKARRVVRELFDAFFNDPALMPDEHEATARGWSWCRARRAAPARWPTTSPA